MTRLADLYPTERGRGGSLVELITIAGAGHQWPGATLNVLAQKLLHTDPPSTALNATQVIWQFFAAHPRPDR
jgi:polyhydroxybutyrate depolymerase